MASDLAVHENLAHGEDRQRGVGYSAAALALLTIVLGGVVYFVSWLQSTEPSPASLRILARQNALLESVSKGVLAYRGTNSAPDLESVDDLSESLDQLAQDYDRLTVGGQTPKLSGLPLKFLLDQSAEREELASRAQSYVKGKPDTSKAMQLVANAQHLRQGVAWATNAWMKQYDEIEHGANMSQLGAIAAAISLLLTLGYIGFRYDAARLKATLELSESTQCELSKQVERLGAIQEQLQAAKLRNLDVEARLEKALAEAEQANAVMESASHRFRELFHGLPIACFTVDANGIIYEWNRAATELFGRLSETVYQQSATTAFPVEQDREILAEAISRAFSGELVRDVEWKAETDNGAIADIVTRAFPLKTLKGEVTGAVVSCLDQTERNRAEALLETQLVTIQDMNALLEMQKIELEQANTKLQTLATTDGLTGLKNHRTFQTLLRESLPTVSESEPLSLILMDVDKFKLFNDTFGHQAGDDVLRRVAAVLEQVSGDSLTAARYGGEEFVVLCPNCGRLQAMDLAEKIRATIEATEWPLRQVTASLGVSTALSSTVEPQDLVVQADQALYYSKENGRNQLHHADDIQPAAA